MRINRREFVQITIAGTTTLLLVGCGDERDAITGASDREAFPLLQPTCGQITEANIEGPFFEPGSPEKANLREPGMTGVKVKLTGRVLSSTCEPLSGAWLDFWQANKDGAYDNTGYILRGHQNTDAQGRYTLETIHPGRYLNGDTYRPSHIHVKVHYKRKLLTTQLYFDGDPYNTTDEFIRRSLIMKTRTDADGVEVANFDFVI